MMVQKIVMETTVSSRINSPQELQSVVTVLLAGHSIQMIATFL